MSFEINVFSHLIKEDKCKCDVNAHCEKGKCVCNPGYVGQGTKGTCKPSKSTKLKLGTSRQLKQLYRSNK